MSKQYRAEDIEVLTGLEPVRRRPGMYTDNSRPNHLATEVIDNSVDEALSGHARSVDVTAYDDGSVEVTDDGRGMPVDIHPEQGMPGVELVLTRLHAGGKFSDKNYQFAGGLHGVGVSVVNALSSRLEVWIRRDGVEHHMSFADGERKPHSGRWARSARGIPGPASASGPTRSTSTPRPFRSSGCGTCCGPRPCSAPACASA